MNRQREKYLRTRAAIAPWVLRGTERSDFRAAIIIPALAESEALATTLAALASNSADYLQQTLVVVVVNNRQQASAGQKQDNRLTLVWLQDNPQPQLNLAWVDACSAGLELPAKEGVGLARKIGFDLALAKLDWAGRPLLVSLDADTLVDDNYLPAICQHFQRTECGAATLPFRHQPAADPQQETAIRHYELYLRSYLFGLQLAGSPYAYHSIGSAFACRAEAYLAAGGMNRRSAAEDFYFLQQLAKTAGVAMLSGTVVRPSARYSDRVPFGTGRAVQAQVQEAQELFQFSPCSGFMVLQTWLGLAASSLEEPAEVVLAAAAELSPALQRFLGELNFAQNWQKLQMNNADLQRRQLAFHGWFDGLRTRQLLTRLAPDAGPGAVDLVAELLEWGGYPGVAQKSEQLLLLERLQNVTEK